MSEPFPWEVSDDETGGPSVDALEESVRVVRQPDMSHFPKRVLANRNEFKLHNMDFIVDELETREQLELSDDEQETSDSGHAVDAEQAGLRGEPTDRATNNDRLNWGGEFGLVHTGDFLTISRSRWQQLVPEHLPYSFDVEADFDRSESIRILQRPAVVDAIRYAKLTAARGFTSLGGQGSVHPRPIVFEPGDEGTGATTGLLSLVLWARLNGWLVAYVPDAGVVQGDRAEHIRIVRSTAMPGCWDVASHSAQFLGHQLAAHGELLKTLPIKKAVQFNNGVEFGEAAGKSLYDLLTFGLASYTSPDSGDRTTVTEVLYHYRMELNRVTAVPVLLAVDRYNGWWSPSTFVDPDAVSLKTFDDVRRVVPPMPSERLTNVCLFRSAGRAVSGLGNGLGAVALSRTRMSRKLYKACLSAIGSAGKRVVLRPYSFDEFKTVHWHYLKLAMMTPDAGWFWGPPADEKPDDDEHDDEQENEDDMIEATKDLPPTPEDYLAVPPSAVKHAYTLTSGYPSELVRLRGMQMFVIKGEEGKRVRIPA